MRLTASELYCYHCGPIPVLLERGVLPAAGRVFGLEFCEDGFAEYAVTFAVDEDDALPFFADYRFHCLVELLHLVFEDGGVVHTRGSFKKC